ncbi:hypothetical protein Aeqsu_3098 [Aequorivita sublithincola DSM 14238]|uniref:Uncharacterized protein n=1 Tax=Aequorivita sublithincola (strain DSM 14238 / LMG 21431 / ACAM 643 / 9-3) TaxID=746697 RepID=I3YZW6_AEQSU|nr:hypothetical protein Aeqsu_3098 [Aequorivita sublithincola DSM 14238]
MKNLKNLLFVGGLFLNIGSLYMENINQDFYT